MKTPSPTFAIVQKLSARHIVAVNTLFCKLMGSLQAGVFLQQCMYWSERTTLKHGWFAKSRKEWEEEIFLGDEAVSNCTKTLESMGILETKKVKFAGAPTIHYRFNGEKLIGWLTLLINHDTEQEQLKADDKEYRVKKFKYKEHLETQLPFSDLSEMEIREVGNGNQGSRKSYTETTTETTTEKKDNMQPAPKAQRARDEMMDAITTTFDIAPSGRVNRLKLIMLGTLNKGEKDSVYNFDIPATPKEVCEFGRWYKNKYRNAELPLSPEKLQSHFYAFRKNGGSTYKTKVDENGMTKILIDGQGWQDLWGAHNAQYD